MTWPAPQQSDLNRKAMPRTPRNRQIAYTVTIIGGLLLWAFVVDPLFGR